MGFLLYFFLLFGLVSLLFELFLLLDELSFVAFFFWVPKAGHRFMFFWGTNAKLILNIYRFLIVVWVSFLMFALFLFLVGLNFFLIWAIFLVTPQIYVGGQS